MARERLAQLSVTKEWVPFAYAKPAALLVYGEFSNNLGAAEDLIRLSYTVQNDFAPITQEILTGKLADRLTKRGYFTDAIGLLATRLTLQGRVAANMVVPEIDGKLYYGYTQEPFIGHNLLADWHDAFMRNVEIGRQRREQAYNSLDNRSV